MVSLDAEFVSKLEIELPSHTQNLSRFPNLRALLSKASSPIVCTLVASHPHAPAGNDQYKHELRHSKLHQRISNTSLYAQQFHGSG